MEFVGQSPGCPSMTSMQELLKEADLAWPLSDLVKTWQTELADIMVRASGARKLEHLVSTLKVMPVKKEVANLNLETQLLPLLTVAKEAAGVSFTASQRKDVEAWWATYMNDLETNLGNLELDHLRVFSEIFSALLKWFGDDVAKKNQVENMKGVYQISVKFKNYIGADDTKTAKDWVAAGPDKSSLAEFMRALELVKPLPTGKDHWGGTSLAEIRKNAASCIADAQEVLAENAAAKLEGVLSDVWSFSCGAEAGEQWYGALGDSCTWEELLEKAETSILQHEPPAFEDPLAALEKALGSVD